MKRLVMTLAAGALLVLPTAAHADEAKLAFGGDQYTAGDNARIDTAVVHDAFAAGYDVSLTAPVSGDAHLAGFNVSSASDVAGDLYAAGFSINVTGKVDGDLTAFGNSVTVRSSAPVPGNVRLGGQNVVLGSAVMGSALLSGQTVTLDAPVTGDFQFLGESLTFGPAAKITGKVLLKGPKPLAVPESVASADRVTFETVASPDYMSGAGKTAETVVKGFWPAFWTLAMGWAVLLVIGAAFIALLPRGLASMQIVAEKRPFRNLGLGVLAFASVVGLVPVFALTLIGIFLLPFVLIFVFAACSLAYLGGVYFAGVQLAKAFVPVATNVHRLGVLAVTLIAAALIGMIPVLGWLATLVFVAFGFGVMAMVLMVRWSRKDAARLEPPTRDAVPAVGLPGAV